MFVESIVVFVSFELADIVSVYYATFNLKSYDLVNEVPLLSDNIT
jgi:hypothetical protein